jgi:hypothetical protein
MIKKISYYSEWCVAGDPVGGERVAMFAKALAVHAQDGNK